MGENMRGTGKWKLGKMSGLRMNKCIAVIENIKIK